MYLDKLFFMKNFYHCLLLLLILLINSDCSYQKRLYRKGYYIDWLSQKHSPSQKKFSSAQEENSFTSIENTLPSFLSNLIPDHFQDKYSTVVASQQSTQHFIKNKSSLLQDTCGDKLILKSGDEFVVKIIEISDKEIKYKRCDNYDGPLYTISKSKVYAIVYSNGVTEHIIDDSITSKSNEEKAQSSTTDKRKTFPDSYWWTWVLFIAGFFYSLGIFTWPYALYYARQARREIRNNPNQYRGYIEMGIIMYFILIFFMLLALTFTVLGVILIFISETLGSAPGASTVAVLVGVLLLVLGIGIILFLNRFFKTSDKSDF